MREEMSESGEGDTRGDGLGTALGELGRSRLSVAQTSRRPAGERAQTSRYPSAAR